MVLPPEERMDLHVHAGLKAAVVERAQVQGRTMNDFVSELLCVALGLDYRNYLIPRKALGRKPGGKRAAPEESPPSKRRKKD